jgi:TetR/AcrR family transcriptional regulator
LTPLARRGGKAERTRAQILEAAERHFAERGFKETRLEDIADDVGLTRATLFYHFRDKQALYAAVVEEVFGALLSRIETLLVRPGPLAGRLERAAEAWVDAVARRPAMARLILREAASADPDGRPLLPRFELFLALAARILEEGARAGELHPIRTDPFHVISAVVGFSVFYVAALRSLIPSTSFDPLDPAELAAHKRDVLHMVRRLLGIPMGRGRLRSELANGHE